MAFDFPASPVIGQSTQGYVWDGQKWGKPSRGDAHVAATPPASPLAGDLWWNSSTGVMYVWSGTVWAVVSDPGGVFTGAAGVDAYAYSGMQVNGSMEVSQQYGTTAQTAGGYVIDGWEHTYAGSMVLSSATSPSPIIAGISSTLFTTIPTAQITLGASDYAIWIHKIEGYRMARLGWGYSTAKSVTICFWTAHARTGTFSAVIRNASVTRSRAFTYTQNVAGTAEYKTVTVPGCTDGTWNTTNGVGMSIVFSMGTGSSLLAPTTTQWYSTNYLGAVGQVNAVASTADVFRIAGLLVLPGTQAPTAAQSPFAMRPYGQELETCQRYFQKWNPFLVSGYNAAGAFLYGAVPLVPPMRASPAIAYGGPVYSNASAFATTGTSSSSVFRPQITITALGYGYGVANIELDARLP